LTRDALHDLKVGLIGLAKEFGPIGVRGLFYQAVVAGIIEKTEQGYDRVNGWRKNSG